MMRNESAAATSVSPLTSGESDNGVFIQGFKSHQDPAASSVSGRCGYQMTLLALSHNLETFIGLHTREVHSISDEMCALLAKP